MSREGRRRIGREPEVVENLPRDVPRLDRGDHRHATATPRTCEHINVEDAPHQFGPRPLAGPLRDARSALVGRCLGSGGSSRFRSGVGAARTRLFCRRRTLLDRRLGGPMSDGSRPYPSVRGQNPMIDDEVDPRARRQSGEFFRPNGRRRRGAPVCPSQTQGDQCTASSQCPTGSSCTHAHCTFQVCAPTCSN